jgi:hypothetical protein
MLWRFFRLAKTTGGMVDQSVALGIWATVASSGWRSRAKTCCCLVPSRDLQEALVSRASQAGFFKVARNAAMASHRPGDGTSL